MLHTSDSGTREWQKAFETVALHLRDHFHKNFPFKDDGEVAPDILALRDAFYSFPVHTDILLIDATKDVTGEFHQPVWTLTRFDMNAGTNRDLVFHGTASPVDLDRHSSLLNERFGIDDASTLESIGKLTFRGLWSTDGTEIIELIPFDARVHPQEYANELAQHLLMFVGEPLIQRFKRDIDFNALYDLQEDPALSNDVLSQIDPTTALFARITDGQPPSLADRQNAIRGILLIPRVPQEIRDTFQASKDLYVYGYFRYRFFTISLHYAFLALEAAIAARWSAALPQKVIVSCGSMSCETYFPTREKILHLSQQKKWNRTKLLVNGEAFPSTYRHLLDWLEKQKIVTKWERGRLDICIRMRNSLSHLESAPIEFPRSDSLRSIAWMINKLFHSLPSKQNP